MSNKDAFGDKRKAQEDEFFRRQERELVEKMRRNIEAEALRKDLAEATGVADEEILRDLQELGYTRETLPFLLLVPLIEVAWADNGVSAREREMIYEVAKARGIAEGTPAYERLTRALEHGPSEQEFQKALRVIRAMFEALPPDQREQSRSDLVSYCKSIAAVSGGFLGLGQKVSAEEQAVIERIAGTIEREHGDAAKRAVDDE